MRFDTWFNNQQKLVKIILLVFPFANWIFEVLVRVSAVIRRPSPTNIAGLVLSGFFGVAMGYIDLVLIILDQNMIVVE